VLRAIGPARMKSPAERTPYDLFALGYAEYLKGTAEGFAESKRYFDEAIAKDPRFTLAIVQRGWASWLYVVVAGGDWVAALNETERFARQAIAADPLEAEAHVELAGKLSAFGNFAEAQAEVERGLKLNPTSADIMMKAAMTKAWLGESAEGAALCDRAFRLNPMPVIWYAIHCYESYYLQGRYADAIDMIERTDAWIPPDALLTVFRIASEAELGRKEEAAATLEEFKRRFPGETIEGMGFGATFRAASDVDRLAASLIKAGAPLCVPSEKADGLEKPKHLAVCDAERAKAAAR